MLKYVILINNIVIADSVTCQMCLIAFNTNIKLQIFNKMRKHALPENIKYMFRSMSTNITETCKLIQIMTLSAWKNKKLDHGLSNVLFRIWKHL